MALNNMKAVHISSVHSAMDPRIRLKEVHSLVEAGWDVTFITGDLDAEPGEGFDVVKISPGRLRRALRILITAPKCIVQAFRTPSDVYHIHDPELILWAWLLLAKRKPVIYDVHEDYRTSLLQKRWLPGAIRGQLAWLSGFLEKLFALPFKKIIAERYYSERFPDALMILNYPATNKINTSVNTHLSVEVSPQLIYAGNVTVDRGAFNMAKLLPARPDVALTCVGFCPSDLAHAMRVAAGERSSNLTLVGEGRYVPFSEILQLYQQGIWLAGVALFPDTPHYRKKELTKFFEYMSMGLPIIASNFPTWKRLIEDEGVGICVDPNDPSEIGAAIDWLRDNPNQATRMGQRGRQLTESKYNWSVEGGRLVGFYSELVRQNAPA